MRTRVLHAQPGAQKRGPDGRQIRIPQHEHCNEAMCEHIYVDTVHSDEAMCEDINADIVRKRKKKT